MKRVKQKDRSGCGIASAAMIKGQSYDTIKEWWKVVCGGNLNRLNTIGDGLRKYELKDLLTTIGLENVSVIETPCIVIVKRKFGKHYVVIDEDGKILDPA